MTSTLTFAGGAGTVTGSKYLVEHGAVRVLLDCGMFQGLRDLRERNWKRPPFDPSTLDAVVVSHAHLDHIGYLPLLVRHGFRGRIHCTLATAPLIEVVLRDAAQLQEEDARRANRRGYSRHHPALPLFTHDDVERVLPLVVGHPYDLAVGLPHGARVTFRRAGHILGAAIVILDLPAPDRLRLVFSGDLGRWGRPILKDPRFVADADVLIVESTYGDREHRDDEAVMLARTVCETVARRGIIVVPSFALGRTQELLWLLADLRRKDLIPDVPTFVDSPMALDVTALYEHHRGEHDVDMRRLTEEGRSPLSGRDYHLVRSADESRALNGLSGPAIIIAGSGMATGGRVLHHLARLLPDPRTEVVLVGFQALGTRGRALQDGATTVRIHGRDVPVRAHVTMLDGLSAHADKPALMRWLRGFERPPAETWVVHGEAHAALALTRAIRDELGWPADVARDGAVVPLTAHASTPRSSPRPGAA